MVQATPATVKDILSSLEYGVETLKIRVAGIHDGEDGSVTCVDMEATQRLGHQLLAMADDQMVTPSQMPAGKCGCLFI